MFYTLTIVLSIYFLSELITGNLRLSQKRAEHEQLKYTLEKQLAVNEELSQLISSTDEEIMERVARDTYNYAYPNERVFVDMGGQ